MLKKLHQAKIYFPTIQSDRLGIYSRFPPISTSVVNNPETNRNLVFLVDLTKKCAIQSG